MCAVGVGGADTVDVMANMPWELQAPKVCVCMYMYVCMCMYVCMRVCVCVCVCVCMYEWCVVSEC